MSAGAPATNAVGVDPEPVRGSLQVSSFLSPDGARIEASGLDALHLFSVGAAPLFQSMSLRADRALVNVTLHEADAYLQSPTNPDSTLIGGKSRDVYQEFERRNLTGTGDLWYPFPNLLAEAPTHSAILGVDAHSGLRITPAASLEYWAGNYVPGDQVSPDDPVAHFHPLVDGTPSVLGDAVAHVTMHGDFRLYVWGVNLTVDSPGEEEATLSTGYWERDDMSAPTGYGVKRTSHAQLVRLDVENGTVDWQLLKGTIQFASERSTVETAGVQFDRATGELRTPAAEYQVQDQEIHLSGAAMINVTRAGSASLLGAEVDATGTLDIPPTRLLGPIEGAPDIAEADPSLDAGSESAIKAPPSARDGFPWWYVLAALALLACGPLLRWITRPSDEAMLQRARRELAAGRPWGCERLARRLLDHNPHHAEAWLLRGVGLLKAGRTEEAETIMTSGIGRIGPRVSTLAFLLSLSLHRSGRTLEARKWWSLVAREPDLWSRLGQETDFDLAVRDLVTGRFDPSYA